MSWSDSLKGAVGNLVGGAEQAALPALMHKFIGPDDLQAIIAKLQAAGLGTIVQSWFDKNRDSLPITPDQLRHALDNERLQQIARSFGIPVDAILNALAEYLPKAAEAAGPAANPAAQAGSKPAASTVTDPTKPKV